MVDKELFESYRKALKTVAGLCHIEVQALIDQMSGMSGQQQAALLMKYYPGIVERFGYMSAEVAREYYQSARDAYFKDDDRADEYTAQAAQTVQAQWAMEDIQSAATGEHGVSVDGLPGRAVKRVMERADQTIISNSGRDSAHPKWAVVPGVDACAWCVMIGSRGFVYKSDITAGAQRHANCKCVVAVDFDTDNPYLSGYDPDELYRRYRDDLSNGTVTTMGSSIGSIGLKSGGGGTVTPAKQPSNRAGTGLNKWEAQKAKDWTNNTILLFDHVQDVGQLKAAMDMVNDTWGKNPNAFTQRQIQGIRYAFNRAKIRLGVNKQQT